MTAREESEEDVERSTYFDAKDILSPPLATSKKKKLTKRHFSKKEDFWRTSNDSSDSEASGFNMSSVSSGLIDTTCSPEQLKKKAEKIIIKVIKAFKLSLKEEALKTLKNDTKRIKTKISIYGEADDEGLNFFEEKLEDQIMKIDQQCQKVS